MSNKREHIYTLTSGLSNFKRVCGCLQRSAAIKWLKKKIRAGEMAQRVRALTAVPEVLSSNPSNHMMAETHL